MSTYQITLTLTRAELVMLTMAAQAASQEYSTSGAEYRAEGDDAAAETADERAEALDRIRAELWRQAK